MTTRSAISRAKTSGANRKASAKSRSAKLPEWNLADLYLGIDAPEIARDLDRIDADCIAFEQDYKGKLAEETAKEGGGAWLAGAVKRYEAIDDLAGRLGSYAGLAHAGDSVDPAITKFYGDVSERLTAASVHLLFFALELNRIDDTVIERAMQAPELGHYRPWIEDSRKDKPYQLEDRVEQLFHEKSQTGYSAFNRLFDQTIAGLRFKLGGKELAIEPTLNQLQDRDPAKRKAAGQALAKTFKANERTFALITNTLAKDKEISDRWRGFEDIADSRHLSNRVEREVVDALVDSVRAAYPKLSHRYYALKARWFKKKSLAHWDRNAPLPFAATGSIGWPEAQDMVLSAYGAFSPEMASIAAALLRRSLDRRPGAAGQGAGRVLASDHAVGASLCADELPGQAARRDDARPRTRPRRASGAGGQERRADGADAADAGGDGQRVRRDADLQAAAWARPRARNSARRCSPARSRT